MRSVRLDRSALPAGCLLAALALGATLRPAWANPPCPAPTVILQANRPSPNAANMGGVLRLDITNTPIPAGYTWVGIWVNVYDAHNVLKEHGMATRINSTTCYYNCVTTVYPNAGYTLTLTGTLTDNIFNAPCDVPPSAPAPVTMTNPTSDRHTAKAELDCSCRCDAVPTQSTTSPQSGDQSFTVPVTSWDAQGATYGLSLTYASHTLVDPQAPAEPDFAGLSERNDHWSHSFAQWVDLYQDEGGTEYAVWHQGTSLLSFPRTSPTMGSPFKPTVAGYTLNYGGGPITSPSFPCNGGTMTKPVEYGWFTITDPDQTEYDFNYMPPAGQTHLYWQTAECAAYPHYLLTRIKDRWGRTLTLTWTSTSLGNGVFEPRVTAVQDSAGNMLTLTTPSPGRIVSITDPESRTHNLIYSPVLDETNTSRSKLTGVQVKGAGSPTPVSYNWSFSYRDPTNPDLAYGGVTGDYTGDLVIQKTEPIGLVTNYQYEAVTVMPTSKARPTEEDWVGRASQVAWTDTDGTARTVSRVLNSPSEATLTFPGGVGVRYDYSGSDLTTVTDVSTGRQWKYTYDGSFHLLTSITTPLETGTNPLVQYTPTVDANTGHVSQIVEQVLQSDLSLGDPVTTWFNNFNLPYQITASHRTGDGLPDQITALHYDNDVPLVPGSHANLTSIVEAMGQSEAQTTSFTYNGTAGGWGLPDSTTNAAGGVSSFLYDTAGTHPSGRLTSAASPANDFLMTTDPDYNPSTTVLNYTTDGLPSLIQDPRGHQVTVGYNAAATGSSNLVITLSYPPNSYQRLVTVDARGRVIQEQDEGMVQTTWSYNAEDQVTSVTRAANQPSDLATTTFHYNTQDDLDYFEPPTGGVNYRVNFEYFTYNQDGTQPPNPPYQGQVTRIRYPDGTSQYFGYNNAAELAWRRKGDGSIVTIGRDTLHRINSTAYPISQVDNGFTVTAHYDEFGRVDSTVDPRGATTLTYDSLNRLMKVIPTAPQKEVDYQYSIDNSNLNHFHRWNTSAMIVGVGSVPYSYQEDNKGRLYQLVSPFNQTTTLHYDADGKNLEVDFPNGTKELRTYLEPQDWIMKIVLQKANGQEADHFTYSYADGTGHLQQEQDAGNRVHAFSYNKRYELTQESHHDPLIGTLTYGYADKNGNRTSRTDASGTDYYGLDANNKLQWLNHGVNAMPTSDQAGAYMLFSYDANGNMIHRERRFADGTFQSYDLYWDGADQLRQINVHGGSAIWAAGYNGDGLRVTMQDQAGGSFPSQHDLTWGLGGLLYDTFSSSTYTPGVSQRVNGGDQFFHTDWLGSTRYLSDSTGNNFPNALRYDAFGNRSATGGAYDPTPLQFAGDWGYQSEWATGPEAGTGLQYLQQRYYDPAVGRFISPDPVADSTGLSLYAYADNDPVDGVDPSGLAPGKGFWNGARNIVGSVAQGVGWFFSRPGVWFASGVRHAGRVTLRPGIPTLQTANREAYPWLAEAGKEINQFTDRELQDIGNQCFYGVVSAAGASRGLATVGAGAANDVRSAVLVRYVEEDETLNEILNGEQGLKSLTWRQGIEHALVELPSGRKAIYAGGRTGISFSPGLIRKLLIHTHPFDIPPSGPSDADIEALRALNQRSSYLLEHGAMTRFFRR